MTTTIDLKHPPRFDGTNFALYKQQVELWADMTDIPKSKIGPTLLLNCIDKAADIISSIDRSKLSIETTGLAYYLGYLESVFGETDNIRHLISTYAKYRSLSRGNDSVSEYIGEFLKIRSELVNLKVSGDMAECLHMISGASLSDAEVSQLLTIISAKGINWSTDVIANQLKQVVQSRSTPVSSSVLPDITPVQQSKGTSKGKPRNQSRYRKSRGKGKGKHFNYFDSDTGRQNSYPRSFSPRFQNRPQHFSKGKGKGKKQYVYNVDSDQVVSHNEYLFQ